MHKKRYIRCSPHHPQTNGKLERAQRNQAIRLLAAPHTINTSVAPSATTTTETGKPDTSDRS
jgi:hypothetical protein